MLLIVAEKLLGKILEPDEAELQAIAGESYAAQGKDDGIKGREDREDQDESDCGRNEKGAGMAVRPFPQLSPGELPAGEVPGWPITSLCGIGLVLVASAER